MTDSNANLAVQLDRCTKLYGQTKAADEVCLDIRVGEFFTLLGASGSGKTTSLRMIGGFERPDAGVVRIMGHDVTRLPAHKRNVHTVFQDYALFPHLSVFENVAFPLRLRSHAKAEIKSKVQQALEMVQLGALGERKPEQLSGGQQQRVALARSLVDGPAVLLLDEPLSALDAKIRHEVREELKSLQRRTGITFVYVTHDQEEALTMSDRIAVMRGGKVLQVGSSIDVYEHPADLFVASFIGKANFLSGTMVQSAPADAKAFVNVGKEKVEATTTTPLPAGAPVKVMIRPENLRITPATGATTSNMIRAAAYLGHATEYLLDTPHGPLRALELRRRGTVPMTETTPVTLSWNADEALIYPNI